MSAQLRRRNIQAYSNMGICLRMFAGSTLGWFGANLFFQDQVTRTKRVNWLHLHWKVSPLVTSCAAAKAQRHSS